MRFISHIERSLLRQCVTCLAKAAGTMAVLAACHVQAAEEASRFAQETLAIAEPQGHIIMALRAYNLPPPTQLLRQYVQNSNCFQVLERGLAMQNIQQERAATACCREIATWAVTADFVMTADVLFKDKKSSCGRGCRWHQNAGNVVGCDNFRFATGPLAAFWVLSVGALTPVPTRVSW